MGKSYSEMMTFSTFEERFRYLEIGGSVGVSTFGSLRFLNQNFYNSGEWREFRTKIIVRDLGRDLAVPGLEIPSFITIHHINPITEETIRRHLRDLLDEENVVCVSSKTHKAIHYGGDIFQLQVGTIERQEGDTTLW